MAILVLGCRGKPATNKHRMNPQLSSFAARLRSLQTANNKILGRDLLPDKNFNFLALELFALQFQNNTAYRKICEARKLTPPAVTHWTKIPAVPAAAFKELELTSLAPAERTAVFHSSGTTEQKPSRHFHSAESLALYEASLWSWFQEKVGGSLFAFAPASRPSPPLGEKVAEGRMRGSAANCNFIALTPPPEQAPHSSLVHMFETIRQRAGGASRTEYFGQLDSAGVWTLNFETTLTALQSTITHQLPTLLLGTAFSFVHLLDFLAEKNLRLVLPSGSRVMETGGYKNRSRTMPKSELHALITARLGVPRENILCEYGMSELSSQAYDTPTKNLKSKTENSERQFRFPPWARVQIISPETGREVADGETGLIRIFDLANVFSVAAIQTEDLGVRRGDDFELIGRAQLAAPRGCSLMTA